MDFCGKEYALAFAILERFSDDVFASTSSDLKIQRLMSVDVGGIQIIDTHGQRLMNNSNGLFFVLSASKVHTAQTKLTDFDARSSKIYIVHISSFNLVL